MDTSTKPLDELVRDLPPDVQAEVRGFVEQLISKRQRVAGRKLRQDWAGGLRDYRDQYSALELQRKSLEWRDQ